uniref:Shisa N-terminal domain-containing protein n=1 Tax=Pygocentrus nattereri TaxID=42514 RepID=A0AAR2JA78_PYGNA
MALSRSACALLAMLCALTPPVRAAAGQYCHGWGSFAGFRCPERQDGGDARYCCGTCTVRYCCSSPSARLDQSTCDTEQPHGEDDGVRTVQPAGETGEQQVALIHFFQGSLPKTRVLCRTMNTQRTTCMVKGFFAWRIGS